MIPTFKKYRKPVPKITCANQIPGYLNTHTLDLLGSRISELRENASVLEIGSLYGRLTWEILTMLPKKGQLSVVESFGLTGIQALDNLKELPESVNFLFPAREFDHKILWALIITQHKRFNQLKLYATKSIDFIDRNKNLHWDLVWLDGCHRYNTVSAELSHFSTVTNEIWGDDYVFSIASHLQAKAAVDDWYSKNKDDWDLTIHPHSVFQLVRKNKS